jgi:GNAT superfamily N-acetyltransferase
MLRPGEAALDAALAARAWRRGQPTLILAAEAAALAVEPTPETALDCEGPLACMAGLWAAGGIGAERRAVMARAAGPKAWLLGRAEDAPAACAFVAAAGGAAMLHALEVAPWARRRGLGALLTRAAASWALAQGAPVLALAAPEANGPARALYAGLGFAEAARYHYRLAPEAT